VRGGNWIDTSLGAVTAGLDALAMIFDPVGALLQYGVAWLTEHLHETEPPLNSQPRASA
jgi:hypothetical protein